MQSSAVQSMSFATLMLLPLASNTSINDPHRLFFTVQSPTTIPPSVSPSKSPSLSPSKSPTGSPTGSPITDDESERRVTMFLNISNSIPTTAYEFRRTTVEGSEVGEGKTYSDVMIGECKKYGMMPLCDVSNYCREDPNSIYIGNQGHISLFYTEFYMTNIPSGWNTALDLDGACIYTGNSRTGIIGMKALCKIRGSPEKPHRWQEPTSDSNTFICVKIL